jgi:hypothetical protein
MMITICIQTASAGEWDSATFTLSMEAPVAYKGDYMIEVVDFDGYGMVVLNISCGENFVGRVSLKNNDTDWYYLDNNIRLKSENITDQRVMPTFGSIYSPHAKLTFATEKNPGNPTSLALSISTDKKEYLLDQEIIAAIDIRNVGETRAKDISLNINSDGLVAKELPQNFSLDKGDQKSFEVKFRFPSSFKATYNLLINASWSDEHGARYFIEDSEIIKLKMPLEIRKSATSEVKLGKQAYVSLSVENVQTIPLRVSLNDAFPISFTPVNGSITDNNLRWEFDLAKGKTKVFTYQMIPSQAGAHRLPKAQATYIWGGEEYTNSSKIENIILVYKGVSYQEQEFGKASSATLSNASGEPLEVSSGEDFSKWVNESGFALSDIKVKNDTLNVFVFIPSGTKILANSNRLTRITIEEEADPPEIPSNLIFAGETYYHLEPDGATFTPFIYFNVPFETSMTDSPSIYRFNGNWNSLGGTANDSRVYTSLSSFSVYAVFAGSSPKVNKSSPKVNMSATILPSISIEVNPSFIEFGELAPGDISSKSDLTIKSIGASSISVTANVTDDAGNLYVYGIYINDDPWKSFSMVLKNESKIAALVLNVPEAYEGVGSKEGMLMFWAEKY